MHNNIIKGSMDIRSPITNSSNIKLIKEFKSEEIIKLYEKITIDIRSYLGSIEKIQLYECLDTGYKFFYPFNLAGTDNFYQELDDYEWYYMPWKWEHEITIKLLNECINVLEIGCARGDFLAKIKNTYNHYVTGLELNSKAAIIARQKGIQIFEENIEDLEKYKLKKFDCICSFQVLEHIADVYSFLTNSIKLLNDNGLLIFSVPNNMSYLANVNSALNLPPHHMGLWDLNTFKKLQDFYPIIIDKVFIEPLQSYHYDGFISAQFNKIFGENNIISKVLKKIFKPYLKLFLRIANKYIVGHTLLVVFKKQ